MIRLRPNPLGIANVSAKPKINAYKPVTDGYTRPLMAISLRERKTTHDLRSPFADRHQRALYIPPHDP